MLVEIQVSMAGVSFSYHSGQQVDLPDLEAKQLIEAGYATPVKQIKVEKAATRSTAKVTK